MTDATKRATFVSSALELIENYGFDGLDLDFEYPASTDQGQGFADLFTSLRSALDSYAAGKGDTTPYLLTVRPFIYEVGRSLNSLHRPRRLRAQATTNTLWYRRWIRYATLRTTTCRVSDNSIQALSYWDLMVWLEEHVVWFYLDIFLGL